MNIPDKFNSIRPYTPEEVPAAVHRMMSNPQFQLALDYLFPKDDHQEIKEGLRRVKSNFEFQKFFMYRAINSILKLSSDGLNLQHTERLAKNGPSVLLANHRDILLDSAILQVVLVDLEMETSEITFGSNLMVNDFIIDFGKVNRMFTVHREGSPREMLQHSKILSDYIRHTIQDKKLSSWIAQRKGRTKNGLDLTDTAVLKMLSVFDRKNPIEAYRQLNILPIIISYEWEPCVLSKVREVYLSRKQRFKKQAGEDLNSVIKGIINYKGKINMSFGIAVNTFIEKNRDSLTLQNIHQKVATFIDQQIYENYHLYPNNYLAYDLLYDKKKYQNQYDTDTNNKLHRELESLYELLGDQNNEIREIYLKLYANPLIQKLSLKKA